MKKSKSLRKKSDSPALRLGIFGATFDPPHLGHLIAAEFAAEELRLDEILLIPANLNPLKIQHQPAPPEIRLEMVKAAAASRPKFKVSDLELKRGGVSYMIDTIRQLQKNHPPHTAFYLLLGTDAAAEFLKWKKYQSLAEICTITVLDRPGWNISLVLQKLQIPFLYLKMPLIDISSSLIRERVAQGKPIDFLTIPGVVEIIRREKLYS